MAQFEELGEELEMQLLFLVRLLFIGKRDCEKAFLNLLTAKEYKCSQHHRFQLNCQQQKPSAAFSIQANSFFELRPTVWRCS